MLFIDQLSHAGAEHPTSGLDRYQGLPNRWSARDYMAPGGALVRAPFTGTVPRDRPHGRASTQNPAAGFGGARLYLLHPNGEMAYLAHFGLAPRDLLVRPGDSFKAGDPIGRVWAWPNDPGRSHIHMGWTAGDPLRLLVNAAGTILANTSRPRQTLELQVPFLRKVDHAGCLACAGHDGRWQVVRILPNGAEKIIVQTTYREALRVRDEKAAWVERQNRRAVR